MKYFPETIFMRKGLYQHLEIMNGMHAFARNFIDC